ncbi:MAG: acyltransferase [Pseudomonadota bacterium]
MTDESPMSNQVYQLPSRIPELDGLRAIAVLAVMSAHAGLPGFARGGVGVYLFFVLSGFLITGILLDADKGKGYFKNFYARRALRIFPIYYMTFAFLLALAFLQGLKTSDWPWYLAYAQNYLFIFKHFPPNFPSCFNHTWSLAVEEQFYFIWPFLIGILGKRRVFIVSLIFIPLAIGLRCFHIQAIFGPEVWTLPVNLNSLGGGAALAVAVRTFDRETLKKVCRALFLGGAIAWVVIQIFVSPYGMGWLELGMVCCTTITFTGLVGTAVLSPPSLLSGFLSLGWMRYIGKISYGLYLYHPLVFLLMWHLFRGQVVRPDHGKGVILLLVLAKFGLTFVAASLSWLLLEKRMNGFKKKFEYTRVTLSRIAQAPM